MTKFKTVVWGTMGILLGAVACGSDSAPPTPTTTGAASARASSNSATPSSAAPSSSKPSPPKGAGSAGVKASISQLPGIDEFFAMAKSAGVGTDLVKSVQIKSKDFAKMGAAEKPIEVGMFLADLAIVSSDESKDVPVSVLEDAEKAVKSLNPPEDVSKLMAETVAEIKKGLKGKELRVVVDRMIARGIPMLEKEAAHKQTAALVRLGAYARTMGLLSKALGAEKDQKKLNVLGQSEDHKFHMSTLETLSADMKKEPRVKAISDALEKSKDAVAKPNIAPDDAKAIATAFGPFAS